jgi:hypothetical protein
LRGSLPATVGKGKLDDGVTSSHESNVKSLEYMQQYSLKKIAELEKSALSKPTNPTATTAQMGDSVKANTQKHKLKARVPWPAHQQESINSFSHVLLVADPRKMIS